MELFGQIAAAIFGTAAGMVLLNTKDGEFRTVGVIFIVAVYHLTVHVWGW